jgi:hypothetical protein
MVGVGKPAYIGILDGNNISGSNKIKKSNNYKTLYKYYSSNQEENNMCEENNISHNGPRQDLVAPIYQKMPDTLAKISQSFYDCAYFGAENKEFIYHKDKYGQLTRKIRKEFRKTICRFLSCIIQFVDVRTLEIGYQDESGRFIRRSYAWLRNKLGMSKLQFDRVIRLLKKYGYITIRQYRKCKNGKFISLIARKVISASLIIDALGKKAWQSMLDYRKYMERKAKPLTRVAKAAVSKVGTMFKNATNPFKTLPQKPDPQDAAKEHALVMLAMEAHDMEPSKSPSYWLNQIKNNLKRKE